MSNTSLIKYQPVIKVIGDNRYDTLKQNTARPFVTYYITCISASCCTVISLRSMLQRPFMQQFFWISVPLFDLDHYMFRPLHRAIFRWIFSGPCYIYATSCASCTVFQVKLVLNKTVYLGRIIYRFTSRKGPALLGQAFEEPWAACYPHSLFHSLHEYMDE
jgi:hypothetical protein